MNCNEGHGALARRVGQASQVCSGKPLAIEAMSLNSSMIKSPTRVRGWVVFEAGASAARAKAIRAAGVRLRDTKEETVRLHHPGEVEAGTVEDGEVRATFSTGAIQGPDAGIGTDAVVEIGMGDVAMLEARTSQRLYVSKVLFSPDSP